MHLFHKYNKIKLSKIVKIISGQAPPSSSYNKKHGFPFLRVNDFRDIFPESDTLTTEPIKICQENDILISTAGTIGLVNLADKKYCIARGVYAIRPDLEMIDTKFLFFYLKSFKAELEFFSTGTVVKIITIDTINNLELVMPPLSVQKQIGYVLENIAIFGTKINELTSISKQLKKSIFYDIFQDSKHNTKKLSELATITRGKFTHRPRNDSRFFGGKVPWIQINDISKAKSYQIKEYSSTLSDKGVDVSLIFPKGTICLSIAATIGKVGILNFDSAFPDSIVGISPETLNPKFLLYHLIYLQEELLFKSTESTQKNINYGVLNDVDIIIPTKIELEKFLNIFKLIDDLDSKIYFYNDLHNKLFSSVINQMEKNVDIN